MVAHSKMDLKNKKLKAWRQDSNGRALTQHVPGSGFNSQHHKKEKNRKNKLEGNFQRNYFVFFLFYSLNRILKGNHELFKKLFLISYLSNNMLSIKYSEYESEHIN